MTRRTFTARPGDAERWIKTSEPTARADAAFRRGQTMADLPRELLNREFPHTPGDTP